MSAINVSNLVLEIQNRIDASTSEEDLLYYTKAIQQLKSGKIFSVSTIEQLPTVSDNLGYLYYVDYDETIYFAAPGGWALLSDERTGSIYSFGAGLGGRIGNRTSNFNNLVPAREYSGSTNWTDVRIANCNSFGLKTNGELWVWGCNFCGTLISAFCNAAGFCVTEPTREMTFSTNWCQVSPSNTSDRHVSAVKSDGTLWSWGLNTGGRLGIGTSTDIFCSPVREFCSATDWCQVSAGFCHTIAIKTSGEMWTWGSNFCGALGDGTTVDKCSPVREISSSSNWCQVSAGNSAASAIKTDGSLWSFGFNTLGQLGDGTSTSRCSPVREFCSATNWCHIDFNCHATVIKTDGSLWVWGTGTCGRLGDGTNGSKSSPVREFCSATDWCYAAAGTHHSAAIKTSGQLWTWGNWGCGALGTGDCISTCTPVQEFYSATNWCMVSATYRGTAAISTKTIG